MTVHDDVTHLFSTPFPVQALQMPLKGIGALMSEDALRGRNLSVSRNGSMLGDNPLLVRTRQRASRSASARYSSSFLVPAFWSMACSWPKLREGGATTQYCG
jgi:hypothetical protein